MPSALKQGLRSLACSPWYMATVVSVIALGIAFIVTIFAVVDGTLFRPLPYRDADHLFAVNARFSRLPTQWLVVLPSVSRQELSVWRAALPGGQFAIYYTGDCGVAIGPKETVCGIRVASDFFAIVGIRPAVGGFSAGDFDAFLPIRPALLTHRFWLRHFAGDPGVIGRTFVGDRGTGTRVVGILSPDFVIPDPYMGATADVITPLVAGWPPPAGLGRSLRIFVRPPSSMSARETEARLTAAAARMAATWPTPPLPPNLSEAARIRRGPYDVVTLQPIREALISGVYRTSATVFWAAIALALLACLNVAGLAAAHVQDRWRDLAVRRSLGAGLHHLLQLLAVQNLVLALLGAAIGVLIAKPMVAVTVQLMPSAISLFKQPAVDLRVVGFAVLTAIACAALITVGSARAAWQSSLRAALGSGPLTTAQRRLWIVTFQVALALVMAVGGALVGSSLLRAWGEDPGVPTDDAALIRMSVPPGTSAAEAEALMADLRRQPGIALAGGIDRWLLQRRSNGSVFDNPPEAAGARTESIAVTTGYFEAAGLRPLAGRLLTRDEIAQGNPVLVVSETVARTYWPGRRAIGQSLSTSSASYQADGTLTVRAYGRAFTVVGVVPDVRYLSLDNEPRGAIYWPLAASPSVMLNTVLVRFDDDRASLGNLVTWIKARCPDCWVEDALMVQDAMAASIRGRRFNAWLFSSFGIAALVIVGVGILGLVAMTTVRRTHEMGIRIALGATPLRLVRQMLGEQTTAVVVGLVAGGVLAAWCVRFVEAYLYRTPVYDPWSWGAAVAALLAVSLVATLLPSLRTSRIDPVRALRNE